MMQLLQIENFPHPRMLIWWIADNPAVCMCLSYVLSAAGPTGAPGESHWG